MRRRPRLAVSLGCPAGVGPEVAVRAAASLHRQRTDATAVLVGDPGVARNAAVIVRCARSRLVEVATPRDIARLKPKQVGLWSPATRLDMPPPGQPTAAAGAAQLAWIDEATALVSDGICDALVTGPVSKSVIAASGARGAKRFRGHTEHLARTLGAREVVMAFHCPKLTTALVTTHLPLAEVARRITRRTVSTTCYWLVDLLQRLRRPGAIAVSGLNPHAGEGGLLGQEEGRVIGPGVIAARKRIVAQWGRSGRDLIGPIGAESAFRLAADGSFAGVVAMYHDQATIAGKLLGFGEMVNVTLGLPIVRTSVDHGTAYDRAGSGSASPRGMSAALSLAAKLVKS